MTTRPFSEILDDLVGAVSGRKPERSLPQIRSRRLDGVLYVRAEDVADALESQAPAPNARLIAKLRGAK